MILVVGGTGTLGTRIVQRLGESGESVRILTRNPERAAALAADGVEVFGGDVRDPADVAGAATGATAVVAAATGFPGSAGISPQSVDAKGTSLLIDAAERANVERFVLLSVVGVGPDSPISLFRAKHEAEERLRASSLSWTIVRPTAFMETWGTLMADMVRTKGKVMVFGHGENPINFVSADDTAALVVRAVSDGALEGRTLSIGGPDDVTFNRFAETVQDVLGTDARTVHVPRPALRMTAVAARAFNRPFARKAEAAYVMDTRPMGFDASELRGEFPELPCTDLTAALKHLHRPGS